MRANVELETIEKTKKIENNQITRSARVGPGKNDGIIGEMN